MLKKKERGMIGMCGFEKGQDGLQVTEGDVMLKRERALLLDNILEPNILWVRELDIRVCHDGTICQKWVQTMSTTHV